MFKQIGKDIIQACMSTIKKGYEFIGYVECDKNGNPLNKNGN